MADNLIEDPDPEQSLAFTVHIAKRLVELCRPLEQRQFPRVLLVALQEPAMDDAASGQREVGLDAVEFPLGNRESSTLTGKDRPFVEKPSVLDATVGAHCSRHDQTHGSDRIRAPLFGVALTPAERPQRTVELWMLTLRRGSIPRVAPLHARMPRITQVGCTDPYGGRTFAP